jgi:hypothetical protein
MKRYFRSIVKESEGSSAMCEVVSVDLCQSELKVRKRVMNQELLIMIEREANAFLD